MRRLKTPEERKSFLFNFLKNKGQHYYDEFIEKMNNRNAFNDAINGDYFLYKEIITACLYWGDTSSPSTWCNFYQEFKGLIDGDYYVESLEEDDSCWEDLTGRFD